MITTTRWAFAFALVAGSAACSAQFPLAIGGSANPAPVIHSTTDLSVARPRILLRSTDIALVQTRIGRVPYTLLMSRMDATIAGAPAPSAADQTDCGLTANIAREEAKARAAKDLAFLYLIDRTWDSSSQSVVVPDPATRQALGDRARDYLLDTCITSRIRIQPDRDINTSNEMIQMVTTYDTLAGSGYNFGGVETTIVGNLMSWGNDFYNDYQPFLNFLTNNHLAKGAATLGTAAIALAGAPGSDPAALDRWLDFGLTKVRQVVRDSLGSGDGTYGEGPFYWRYASENVVPFARAYDAVSNGAAWQPFGHGSIESIWRSRWFTEIGRWELDMTRPDGTLAPIDDSNVDDAYFFGALPSSSPYASAYAWRWANTPTSSASVPYESNGNVDLAADEIVTFDDQVRAMPPSGSPNRLYGAGGDLVFRSNWSSDAVVAFVQAEHGGSRGFGRAPGQPGVPFVAVHDHADPGSFLLDAYGERLLLDPGYMNYTWTLHGTLSDPSAHNLVLVGPASDPQSPGNPNTASTVSSPQLDAFTSQPNAPVPVDGEAYVSHVVNQRGIAAATVTSAYGRDPGYIAPSPLTANDYEELAGPQSAQVQRRFVFIDNRYLVIADSVKSAQPRTYSWPIHGNGGGADGMTAPLPALQYFDKMFEPAPAIPATHYSPSGGTFAATADGGVWARSLARVTTAMAFDQPNGAHSMSIGLGVYEQTHGALGSNAVLTTQLHATNARAASVIYPTRTTGAPPSAWAIALPGVALLRVSDVANDHEILVLVRGADSPNIALPQSLTGMPVAVTTDATIAVIDVHRNGAVSRIYSEGGSHVVLR